MIKFLNLFIVSLLLITSLYADNLFLKTKTEVLDKRFQTAGVMFAYTEFELSGEPLAEALGLDLDTMDSNAINQPTEFDYTAAILSYEYSEEAMYALNYQSKMGPHLLNGLLNSKRGGDMKSLTKRLAHLAKVTGNKEIAIPRNMHLTALPYISGLPEFALKPDNTIIDKDMVFVFKNGEEKIIETIIPLYLVDYKTLGWVEDKMDKTFNPASLGSSLLKDTMWAQDFLSGMHNIELNEEVDVTSSTMDKDEKIALGVSAYDALNGVILTELAHEKILFMQEKLCFDGKKLGVILAPSYKASKHHIWFAHKVAVKEGIVNSTKSVKKLRVIDSSSTLRDTWSMLWAISEFYGYSDQRKNNKNKNLAFLSVFDGDPFKSAPTKNTDSKLNNDIRADDPFSVASNLLNMMFENISTMHFNKKAGTFIDIYDAKQGDKITSFDAAYSIEALRIFQRVSDALPVGYSSGESSVSLDSIKGKKAIELIIAQADFLIKNLKAKDGLFFDAYIIGKGPVQVKSIGTQFAIIRGLVGAYLATHKSKYRKEARSLMISIEENMYDKDIGTYVDATKEYTPYAIGAVSGGLRNAILHLKNVGSENVKELELKNLIDRYVSWFNLVVNGNSVSDGAQLSEWLHTTGEFVDASNANDANADKDNVPSITANNTAMTMAAKVKLSK